MKNFYNTFSSLASALILAVVFFGRPANAEIQIQKQYSFSPAQWGQIEELYKQAQTRTNKDQAFSARIDNHNDIEFNCPAGAPSHVYGLCSMIFDLSSNNGFTLKIKKAVELNLTSAQIKEKLDQNRNIQVGTEVRFKAPLHPMDQKESQFSCVRAESDWNCYLNVFESTRPQ